VRQAAVGFSAVVRGPGDGLLLKYAVDVEITPEPTPEERDALLQGLEGLLRGGARLPAAYRSAWRAAGIREATGADAANATARTPSEHARCAKRT
jgi:hypothetical protein